ncbi:hypothetical protein [Nonomuraea sp. NPDC049028]|uniref:hypothetical protein n=1 Tax=Nonomuraea sp. NPDC049028 TaxID=3364348 RepID=UPI0037146BEF
MNTSARDRGKAGQDFSRVWGILAHIVPPTTFVAAIMMYFGAVRTNTMYGRLGVNQSMLGLSFQDYVQYSVAPTIKALVLVLVVALIAAPVHVWLTRSVAAHRTATMWTVAVAAVLGVASAVVGIMEMTSPLPGLPDVMRKVRLEPLQDYVVPIGLGLGAFALVYSASLYRRLNPRQMTPSKDQIVWRAICAVCAALLLVLLLWAVTVFAQQRGKDEARQFQVDPSMLPSTVVYAARRLYLEDLPETQFPDPNAMFRYRYTGLRLLIHSNRRYFLLPECWWATNSQARVIVLPDDDSLRLEFSMNEVWPACPPGQ